MRTIIAGSRDIEDYKYISHILDDVVDFTISMVLCGTARGVDSLGERYALSRGIPVVYYRPNWTKFGRKRAGFIRNEIMAEDADALVAFWDGTSSGTDHMINTAHKERLIVQIYTL